MFEKNFMENYVYINWHWYYNHEKSNKSIYIYMTTIRKSSKLKGVSRVSK